ncbi:uncharacterized protein LOC103315976 [Nasonia vitripennis]|uniref:Uncharacterized protein n=1 Tax=Nasonia vitripennis TaxID=7425 RepID=A0A7M7QD16_NASVI|nr:uncharacterized protein LOC103315976 [Nasonia vitripennis]
MKEMKTTTNEIKQEVQNFKTLLNKNVTVTKEYIGTIKQICDKFNYKIPFQIVQEFQTNVLQTGLDPTFVLSRSIVNMLKMYLSREVAAQYVAVKQKKHEYVMKPTNFFSLAEALIIERRSISHIETSDNRYDNCVADLDHYQLCARRKKTQRH